LAAKRLLKLQRELQTVKLLIVDELGYVPWSPTASSARAGWQSI
jgi:DNA replication protein DnaC